MVRKAELEARAIRAETSNIRLKGKAKRHKEDIAVLRRSLDEARDREVVLHEATENLEKRCERLEERLASLKQRHKATETKLIAARSAAAPGRGVQDQALAEQDRLIELLRERITELELACPPAAKKFSSARAH